MLESILLFGLNIAPLFNAIATVESENGRTSDNIYQLTEVYVKDCNRISGRTNAFPSVAFDGRASKSAMIVYWSHYCKWYHYRTGKPITYEVMARIHNGGPMGAESNNTIQYWKKVKEALDETDATAVSLQ